MNYNRTYDERKPLLPLKVTVAFLIFIFIACWDMDHRSAASYKKLKKILEGEAVVDIEGVCVGIEDRFVDDGMGGVILLNHGGVGVLQRFKGGGDGGFYVLRHILGGLLCAEGAELIVDLSDAGRDGGFAGFILINAVGAGEVSIPQAVQHFFSGGLGAEQGFLFSLVSGFDTDDLSGQRGGGCGVTMEAVKDGGLQVFLTDTL